MQTVVLAEPGRLDLEEWQEPAPPALGQALVRVRRVGVCGTDLHAYRGRQTFFTYPRVLGHELGVEVVALNPGEMPTKLQVGDRCVVEPYLICGTCIACRRGKTNCCVNMRVLGVHTDGGMRPYITVPIALLHRSYILSLDELALVEMLAIGAHAVDRAQVEPGKKVLVIGAGPIGLSTIQFAQAAGASVIALDMDANRLQFCQSALGVAATVSAGSTALDMVRDLTKGDFPTVVFDATGNPASMNGALAYLAHGGRLVFVGHHPGEIVLQNPEFHRRETTLLGSRNATSADLRHVIEVLETGKVHMSPWLTHRAPLAHVPDQFPIWLRPDAGVIKAMIEV